MPNFLKKLELNGFKSFAGKTVLEFPAGITAIVGPNGCGKSNIVDAIRWLLGEREARNLRGARAEDLIFAGTPKRPRVGLAQATLYFENKNKFFPIDFAEISITREVSRDGISRYFLNKSEILLRDLIDFLAKVRLGSRGLSVITQGNNDVIIKATPKERREMIEEILGLREYQLKKADAERRLKTSEINLDKAKALMEEILPHLRSLKRQTSRWERRDILAAELRELENQFFGFEFQKLTQRINSLDEEIAAQRKQFEVLLYEKEKAEEYKRQIELSQPEENKELKQIREKIREIFEKKIVLEKEISRLETQMQLITKEENQSAHSLSEALDFIRKLKTKIGEIIKDENKDIRANLLEIVSDIEEFLSKEKSVEGRANQLLIESEIGKISKDLEAMGREIEILKEKEKSLEKNQEEFYKTFKEAVFKVEIAREKIRKWEAENQGRLIQRERLQTQLEEISHQIIQVGRRPEEFINIKLDQINYEREALEKRIIRLRGELASMGEVDESLVKEAKETEARYEFLKKEVEDLEKAKKDLRQLISDLNEKINREFKEAISKINNEFNRLFNIMFGGGYAKFVVQKKMHQKAKIGEVEKEDALVEDKKQLIEEGNSETNQEEEGVEIEIKLPRKKIEGLEALSGGERSLVSIAALFALISVSPPPFLVIDEIDAALDERNAKRFADMLKEFSRQTQFIVITHNRVTMEAADVLYGVTLGEDGTSKVLSLKLEKKA